MECSFLTTFVAMTTEESVVRRKPSETSRKTAAKTDTKSRITTPTGTLDKNGLPSYDSRHPNYVGFWKRSIPNIDDTIAIDDIDEPHIKRRHAMLAAHPDIKTLYGIEPSTKYVIAAIVSVQLALAYYFGQVWSTGQTGKGFMLALIVCAFVIGGTITQLIGVIIHEATHGLIFESPIMNKIAGIVSNLALPVPIAQSFRRYHLEHHAFQGVVGKDPDLPLDFEVKLIKGNTFAKIIFITLYPVMYVVRGLAMQKAPSDWEYINVVTTVVADVLIWRFCGPIGFFYMFLSLWFGYSFHPAAAHFIQEHFTFADGQETYSYYGGLNKLFLNIGYHNEHHDFTKIPWSKLPTLKAMAPEFYDTLLFHDSWMRVHWDFIFNSDLGPQSRVGRSYDDHKRGRKMLVANKGVNVDEVKLWEDGNSADDVLNRHDSGILFKK
ncbi:sphingolipid delta-4 desaturase [Batrachochytrium dendrobatidis]|nr:sphingolipid delta-4 desaturase [Batrachochytrium dendrobatidis]KAK5666722.1 sphingolipid delta-4 desaturase [Batrachochytrium dendrobatidis]